MPGRKTIFDIVPRVAGRVLEGAGDFPFVLVDAENGHRHFLAFGHDVARVPHPLFPAHFRNVNKTLHARDKLDKCAEIGEPGYFSLHRLAGREHGGHRCPRVCINLFDGQRYLGLAQRFPALDAENKAVHLLPRLKRFGKVLRPLPRHFRYVNKPLEPAEVHKQSVRHDAADGSWHNGFRFHARRKVVEDFPHVGFEKRKARHHDIPAALGDAHDHERQRLVEKHVRVFHALEVHLRNGAEGLLSHNLYVEAALVDARDFPFDREFWISWHR